METSTDLARVVLEHMSETKPEVLRIWAKDDQQYLKETVLHSVKRAQELTAHYQKNSEMNSTEIMEMVHNYLAPVDDLPEEMVNELTEKEIDLIMEQLDF